MTLANLIDGLLILQNHDENATVCAEHDQIFAGSRKPLSAEDAARMEDLGWLHDLDGDGWCAWV
jgi:hypothetical protein